MIQESCLGANGGKKKHEDQKKKKKEQMPVVEIVALFYKYLVGKKNVVSTGKLSSGGWWRVCSFFVLTFFGVFIYLLFFSSPVFLGRKRRFWDGRGTGMSLLLLLFFSWVLDVSLVYCMLSTICLLYMPIRVSSCKCTVLAM